MKRILLFVLTNVAIMIMLSVVLGLLGVGGYITPQGLDYGALMVFSLIWGFGGAMISLAISRWMAKKAMGVQLVDGRSGQAELDWLYQTVEQLTRKAGLPMPEVGIYDSPEVNAFATGPSKRRSLVAVSSGLLRSMRREEVEGVLAHEVSHIQNGDMVTMTLIQGVVNAFSIFFSRVIANIIRQLVDERISHLVFFVSTIVFDIVFSMLGMVVVAWFSRAREFRADAGAAVLSSRSNMIAALQRLAVNKGLVDNSQPQLATMKIHGTKGKGLLALMSTHPPLEERIARAPAAPAPLSDKGSDLTRLSTFDSARGQTPLVSSAVVSETVEAEGHLIDSGNFQSILTTIVEHGSEYEILRFDIGRKNEEGSHLILQLQSDTDARLQDLLAKLSVFGCFVKGTPEVLLRLADMGGAAPVDFYSTTNHRTSVYLHGAWVVAEDQRMDAALVVSDPALCSGHTAPTVACRKLRDIKAGDLIVCGMQGIRVSPDVQSRDKPSFGFMSNEVSSERRVETAVTRVAEMMRRAKGAGGRIAFVAGPVVVHTGGSQYFCELIRLGYVHTLLSGNALAVHDIEVALSGTSLGIDLNSGHPVEHGHRNHMRAINAIRRAGGIGKAVATGVLTSGIMHACHAHGVNYILAGSIRDDGPLPETIMDLVAAQDAYAKALAGVEVVVMLSSMLHSIGVGNMLPSWVKVICVDINPAVVTKLSDRGSTQTIGIVTDVGLFLHQLAERLQSP